MRSTVSLQALTDRVLGIAPPNIRARTGRPNRGERLLALALLAISAGGTLGSLGLWMAGHGTTGLRLFCGTILLLFVLVRLR